ncbi:MAG: hypothetical protein WA736_06345 [Candidatus Acidiferrum sp.]
MNTWGTYSSFQFNAHQAQMPSPWGLHISQCLPHRFAEYYAARDAVEHLAFAEDNWDGYGAIPINFQTKTNAKVALIQLESSVPAPQVTPNPNGTFSFEWETEEGAAHLEIGRTKYSFYLKPINGAPYFARGHVNQLDAKLGFIVDDGLFPKNPPTLTRPTNNV